MASRMRTLPLLLLFGEISHSTKPSSDPFRYIETLSSHILPSVLSSFFASLGYFLPACKPREYSFSDSSYDSDGRRKNALKSHLGEPRRTLCPMIIDIMEHPRERIC